MGKKANPNQMLLDLVRTEGSDVVHLPYSPEFEEVCNQINPDATTEDKHALWETLLKLREHPAPVVFGEAGKAATTEVARAPIAHAPAPRSPVRLVTPPEESGLLFHAEEPIPEMQPWAAAPERELPSDLAEKRAKVLAALADSRLATDEQRVARILERFPETRESDISLCLRYWQTFQADVIERWQPLELEILFELERMDTLGRARRFVQNDLRLFRGLAETRKARELLQQEFHAYIAAHRDTLPEIRFYLDETGNEGDKAYTGVAGVCIINWKQFEKHGAALQQWRDKQDWAETIHFSETGADKVDRAAALMAQLSKRRAGVLFLGYSISSRGRTQEAMFSLFLQLVVDSLKHLRQQGCLGENRGLRVIKEADPGFDEMYLEGMTKQLEEMVTLEFPGRLAVLPVEAVTKGRHALLECADLIAGGMQRRALGKGRNPKDKVAEAVINVTGFEDGPETGALFKYFAPGR